MRIEIKTQDNNFNATAIASKYGTSIIKCKFGDSIFKECIHNSSYRVQVLHHASVLNLPYMLFVVASATRVTYSVMVEISSDDI